MQDYSLDNKKGIYFSISWKTAISVTIWAGIIFRLYHYLLNRSLFGDEAYVALNIIYRDFKGLLQPLEYSQRAPLGYLWVVKLFGYLFGYNEYVLRLFSIITGIAALFVFRNFLRKHFSPRTVWIGVFVLAFSEPLLYYSSELKQYMGELLVTLLICCYCIPEEEEQSYDKLIQYGLLGAILLWFSFPSVFILVGIAVSLVGFHVWKQDWNKLIRYSWVYLCWALSFLINFIFFVKSGTQDEGLQTFWQSHFMPFSTHFFYWFARTIYQTLDTPLGLEYSILAVIAMIVGLVRLWRSNPTFCLMLLVSVLLTLAASGAHKYPFHKRFLLFLAPVFITWVSVGADSIAAWLKRQRNYWHGLGLLFFLFLLVPPLVKAFYQVIFPKTLNEFTRQEIRVVLQEVLVHRKPGERLYVHSLAWPQFRYYSYLLDIDRKKVEYITKVNPAQELLLNDTSSAFFYEVFNVSNITEFTPKATGKRSWFLFCRDKWDEEKNCLKLLEQNGKKISVFSDVRAAAYLYDVP